MPNSEKLKPAGFRERVLKSFLSLFHAHWDYEPGCTKLCRICDKVLYDLLRRFMEDAPMADPDLASDFGLQASFGLRFSVFTCAV